MIKTAYLTIDDCPTKDFRKKIDFLYSCSIPAILFCIGSNMESFTRDIIYAIEKGFIIGNHSYNHPFFSNLTLESCYEEILKTDELIEQIYFQSGITRPAKLFRFPYGDKGGLDGLNTHSKHQTGSEQGEYRKKEIQDFLGKLEYRQPVFRSITYNYFQNYCLNKDLDLYWTYDVCEWSIFEEHHICDIDSLEKVYKKMAENYPEDGMGLNYFNSEDIILLHDHEASSDIFNDIILTLIKKQNIVFKMPDFV